MEDWIGILFAVGFIIFKVWDGIKGDQNEATPATTPQADWEDKPFNPEEPEWMDEMPETTHPVQGEEQPQKVRSLNDLLASLGQTARTEKVKRATVKATEATKSVASEPMTTKQSGIPIGKNLRSPQEARRAFIYSEIFKKKYE